MDEIFKALEGAIPEDPTPSQKLKALSILVMIILRMTTLGYFTQATRQMARQFVIQAGPGVVPLEYGEAYEQVMSQKE